jgi:FAD/FMN-containing dehydrogenase
VSIVPQLIEIVGEENVSVDRSDLEAYGLDWTRFYNPDPTAIVFVRNTAQVLGLVRFAKENDVALVPSGGRTGLSGGACATNGEIVVSFDKMNQIKSFSAQDACVVVEPGVVTAALQNYAADQGLFYPVDFASSGSSQIGGNIATNAGGIRVIRYGLTRNWISGLKIVTGNGDLLTLNKGLTKNNTGYDLRHLFVGSEGTLGFIVEATIQLIAAPLPSTVILMAVDSMQHCLSILPSFKKKVTLNAFEFFSDNATTHVLATSDLTHPFRSPSPFYVLLEFENSGAASLENATAAFQECLDEGWVTDGIVSTSDRQSAALWQYRERISEAITPRTPYKNDISVKISRVPEFLKSVDDLVQA